MSIARKTDQGCQSFAREEFTMKRSLMISAVLGLALLAGLVFTVRSLSSTTTTDAQAMQAANQLVEAGHTAEALRLYEQLARQNPQDAALLYNMGNVHLLQGDASQALAAYEQAAALAPRDADIRANLELARQTLGLAQPAAGPVAMVAGAGSRWLTGDELALLALGAWLTLGLLVFVGRAWQPAQRPAALRLAMTAALVLMVTAGGLWASRTLASRSDATARLSQQAAAGTLLADPS